MSRDRPSLMNYLWLLSAIIDWRPLIFCIADSFYISVIVGRDYFASKVPVNVFWFRISGEKGVPERLFESDSYSNFSSSDYIALTLSSIWSIIFSTYKSRFNSFVIKRFKNSRLKVYLLSLFALSWYQNASCSYSEISSGNWVPFVKGSSSAARAADRA